MTASQWVGVVAIVVGAVILGAGVALLASWAGEQYYLRRKGRR